MDGTVQIPTWLFGIILGFSSLLLTVIGVFLYRLLGQLDGLREGVVALNSTILKLEGDLGGEVKLLQERHANLTSKVTEFDQVWDRLRMAENDITEIKNGGCEVIQRCITQ